MLGREPVSAHLLNQITGLLPKLGIMIPDNILSSIVWISFVKSSSKPSAIFCVMSVAEEGSSVGDKSQDFSDRVLSLMRVPQSNPIFSYYPSIRFIIFILLQNKFSSETLQGVILCKSLTIWKCPRIKNFSSLEGTDYMLLSTRIYCKERGQNSEGEKGWWEQERNWNCYSASFHGFSGSWLLADPPHFSFSVSPNPLPCLFSFCLSWVVSLHVTGPAVAQMIPHLHDFWAPVSSANHNSSLFQNPWGNLIGPAHVYLPDLKSQVSSQRFALLVQSG